MSAQHSSPSSSWLSELDPSFIENWFPQVHQQRYVDQLRGRHGLTRRQAECFVRLWGYCQLKQNGPVESLETLAPLKQSVPCTQREAAALFYNPETDRGSDRSAGMMINKLISKKLVRKDFDGNLTYISIHPPSELFLAVKDPAEISLQIDDFNPRTDAVRVASFLAENYNWLMQGANASAHKITRVLRQWGQQYPVGMRVMRRQDNGQPVGFFALFPTHNESEQNFFMPPSLSLHLSSIDLEDPIKLAPVGDDTCYAVFIRSWHIDKPYKSVESMTLLLQDAQQILQTMRGDFPNLCDLYAPNIYPEAEELCRALGFQITTQDPNLSLCWMHLALDHFLDNHRVEASIAHLF